jgi:hypothetical protein
VKEPKILLFLKKKKQKDFARWGATTRQRAWSDHL